MAFGIGRRLKKIFGDDVLQTAAITAIGAATGGAALGFGALALTQLPKVLSSDVNVDIPDVDASSAASPTARRTDTGALVSVGADSSSDRISGKKKTALSSLGSSRAGLNL